MELEFKLYNKVFDCNDLNEMISIKYLKKYTNEDLKSLILSKLSICTNYLYVLIEKTSKRTCGLVSFRKRIHLKSLNKRWFIYGVVIAPDFRGFGLGKKLLLYAIEELKNRNVKDVYLYVDENNSIAINLYKQIGFFVISTKAKYDNNEKNFVCLMRFKINSQRNYYLDNSSTKG